MMITIEELKPKVRKLVYTSEDILSRTLIPAVAFDEDKIKLDLKKAKIELNDILGEYYG